MLLLFQAQKGGCLQERADSRNINTGCFFFSFSLFILSLAEREASLQAYPLKPKGAHSVQLSI